MGFGGRDGRGGFEGSVEADQASSQAPHVFLCFFYWCSQITTEGERERVEK